jgi:hypothetical protein
MEISQCLDNLIKKFPFGFSSFQLIEQAKMEHVNLTEQQIKDYLYRSKLVLYDKKRKIFIYNPISKPIIDASIVNQALLNSKEAIFHQQAQQIAQKCLQEAKKGHSMIEIPISLEIHPHLEKLGFKIIIIDNLTQISWT